MTISTSIPQARRYIPRYAGLELTKIVLWTAPDEKVDDFYFFMDEINVLTDLFETRFDGEDLADPDYPEQHLAAGKQIGDAKMKTRLTIALLALAVLFGFPAFAQNVVAGQPTPSEIGKDQAQQLLKEVSVDKFEDSAFWYSAMPLDMGVAETKRLRGSPAGKTAHRG